MLLFLELLLLYNAAIYRTLSLVFSVVSCFLYSRLSKQFEIEMEMNMYVHIFTPLLFIVYLFVFTVAVVYLLDHGVSVCFSHVPH